MKIKRKLLFQEINKHLPFGREAYKHYRAKDMVYPHFCFFCKKLINIADIYREVLTREKGTKWSKKGFVCVCLECEKRFI